MQRPIENNSSPGQAVYDPFCGSGTTLIAAEMTGRSCHALELDPAYVDVAVRRWQVFTGHQARHEASGRSFDEVAGERVADGVANMEARRGADVMLRRAQPPAQSLMEACTNVAFGFVLALVIQAIVYPLYGIHTTLITDGTLAVVFTLASLLRSYLIRRAFETFGARRADKPEPERLHARP